MSQTGPVPPVSDVDIEARLWNPRGKSQDVIDQRAEYLAQFFDAGRTAEERAAIGITDGTIRLSVGIESADDLVNDLRRALDTA